MFSSATSSVSNSVSEWPMTCETISEHEHVLVLKTLQRRLTFAAGNEKAQ